MVRVVMITTGVMAGQKREARLRTDVPAIHVAPFTSRQDVDARHKAGHDERIEHCYDPNT
jgi:hypothetical protein